MMVEHVVGDDPDEGFGARLDTFLSGRLEGVSRSKVQKLIEGGAVLVNGEVTKKPSLKLGSGDIVKVGETTEPSAPPSFRPSVVTPGSDYSRRPQAEDASKAVTTEGRKDGNAEDALSVLFEDDYVIVVDKPPHLSVHPGAGHTGVTLVDLLLDHCGTLGKSARRTPEADLRPGIVHRLDRGTSGAMVCAKTDLAHAHLAKQFHDKTNEREYVALLDGKLQKAEVDVESYLHRDPKDRTAFTSMAKRDYERLAAEKQFHDREPVGYRWAKTRFTRDTEFFGRLTLARATLFTGRTHQIRVHAKAINAAVLGDPVYHKSDVNPAGLPGPVRAAAQALGRQMLHARVLGFDHPKTGQRMRFEAPYPKDFLDFLVLVAKASEGRG